MGQIANQMLLEWCHKMAQKIGRSISGKKSVPMKEEQPIEKEVERKAGQNQGR